MRRQKLQPVQDANASKKLALYSESLETGPLKMMCCKLAKMSLATGSELADIAEKSGFKVGPFGIFELEEDDLEVCEDDSEKLQALFSHLGVIERIKKTIAADASLAPAYLQVCWLRAEFAGLGLGFGGRDLLRTTETVNPSS